MPDGRATSNRVRWTLVVRLMGVRRATRMFFNRDFRRGWRESAERAQRIERLIELSQDPDSLDWDVLRDL